MCGSNTLHPQALARVQPQLSLTSPMYLTCVVVTTSRDHYRRVQELSVGQQRRLALAVVLADPPEILLLDEPTSALDMSVQAEILNLLNDLKRQDGLTMVLVSHDPDVIDHMCDRAVRMAQGRIIEQIGA